MIICPDCRSENLPGTDVCESCGQDLSSLVLSVAKDEFEEHLMNDSLSILGASEAVMVAPGDPVAFAIREMRQRGAECVLVRDESGIQGILTERDILMKAAGPKVDLNALAARDIMSPDPVILRGDDSLAVALHKMSIGGFRHIPFLAEGKEPLVVSVTDLFRHVSGFIGNTR
jgi:CBS domain-containing protein